MKTRFLVYGLTGWCTETLWTGLGSLVKGDLTMYAWTYIWMFPIYGSMIFLEPVHDRIRHFPAALRGGVYAALFFIAEYATGSVLKAFIGRCPWNYAGPYSVHGMITLTFIPVWFAAGLLFEKLHDFLIHKEIGELHS